MNAYQVVVNISVNSQGVNQGVNAYTTQMNQITKVATQTAQASALSFSTFFGANFFAGLAKDAVDAFASNLTSGFLEMTKFAARTEELGVALTGLSKVNNIAASSIKEVEKSLKDANIATQTARQVLSQYIAAGLPLEKATPLANVAKDLAVIAGVSSSEEFQRLIVGITTLNNRVLRTGGVYVQAKDAEKAWAEQHGKSVLELTTEEKQLAVLNGILEFGTRATGLYGLAMDTTAKQMRSLERIQQDFMDAVGGQFIPILGVAVVVFTKFLQIFTAAPEAFVAATAGVALFTVAIIAMNTAQIASLPILGTLIESVANLAFLMTNLNLVIAAGTVGEIALATAGWVALIAVLAGVTYAVGKYIAQANELKPLTDDQLKTTVEHSNALTKEAEFLNTLTDGVVENADQQKRLAEIYKDLNPVAKARVSILESETEQTKQLVAERANLLASDQLAIETEGISRAKELNAALQQNIDLTELRTQAQQLYNASDDPQLKAINLQIFTKVNGEIDENQKRLAEAASALSRYSQITGVTADKALENAKAHGDLSLSVEDLKKKYIDLTGSQKDNHDQGEKNLSQIDQMIDKYNELTDVVERSSERRKIIDRALAEFTEAGVGPGENPKAAAARFAQNLSPQLKALVDAEKLSKDAKKAIEDLLFPSQRRSEKTEFQKLTDDVARLNAEIASFQDLTSKEFQLRFQKEDLSRTKADFEKIITLRRELALPLDGGFPQGAQALDQEIERLKRLVDVKEAVTKATNEQLDAEKDLAIALQTQNLPVVDAATRAAIGYSKAVRDLANSDQQLTADVIVQSKLRQDRIRDETATTFRAYQDLRLNLLKENETLNKELESNKLFNLILAGNEGDIQAKIESQISLKDIQTPTEIQTIASNTTSIMSDVQKIANHFGGGTPAATTNSDSFIDATTGQRVAGSNLKMGPIKGSTPDWIKKLPKNNAYTASLPVVTVGGVQVPQDQVPEEQGIVTVSTKQAGVNARELITQNANLAALAAREKATADANKRILANEALLKAGLIDLDKDVEAARSDNQVRRLTQARAIAIELNLLDDDFAHAAEQSADKIELAYKRERNAINDVDDVIGRTKATIEFLNQLRVGNPTALGKESAREDSERASKAIQVQQEILDLRRKLFSVDPNDIGNRAQDEAARYEDAWLKALDAVKEADIAARESMIASQVKIADATIYHSDQANAKVLEFLAQQKTVTDAVADAKIGVIQGTYSLIDKGLDKVTQKLGAVGSILKDLLSTLIKASLNKFFLSLFGLNQQGGGSASAGGSGGGGGGFLSGLLQAIGGGGSASSGGIFSNGTVGGTPPFVGNFFAPSGGGSTGGGFLGGALGHGGNPFAAPSVQALLGLGGPSLSSTSISGAGGSAVGGAARAGVGAGGGLLSQIFGGGSLGQLGKGLGQAAPLLGLALGSQVGGSSITGNILGGIGGLAGGLAVGIGTGAIGASGGIIGGLVGALGGTLAATGILAAVAVPLIIGAWLLGRDKLRKTEEKQRTAILTDSKSKLTSILDDLRGGRIDSATALANAQAIRADYLTQVGALKDKKTRNIAVATVRELDGIISQIQSAGYESDAASERFKLLVPTFASGGNIDFVSRSQGGERAMIATRDDELVLTQRDVAALGGAGAMQRAGVRGYSSASMPSVPLTGSASRSMSLSSPTQNGGSQEANQLFVLVGDDKAADAIVQRSRPGTIARKMSIHVRQTGFDGFVGDFIRETTR
jgi:hypothetical protein